MENLGLNKYLYDLGIQTKEDFNLQKLKSIDELKTLDNEALVKQKVFLTNSNLLGFFHHNPTASKEGIDNYNKIETYTGEVLERIDFGTVVDIRKYGAVNDWSDLTRTGTDCTEAFQLAHDECVEKGGGTVFVPIGKWLVNGTIQYCNSQNVPVAFEGQVCSNQVGQSSYGSCIVRNVAGVIFNVNLNTNGSAHIAFPELFKGCSIRNLAFVGKKNLLNETVFGITAIKCFRVQGGIFHHLSAHRINVLIDEQPTDSAGFENYNDQSSIFDIRITESLEGGLNLNTKDVSKIQLFVFQAPSPTCVYGIRIKAGTTVVLENILWWSPALGYAQYSAGSAFIEIQNSLSVKISSVHIERSLLQYAFKFVSCRGVDVRQVHSRFFSNDFFYFQNCINVLVDEWTSWEDKGVDKGDFYLGSANLNISFKRCLFRSSFLLETFRDAIIKGVGGIVNEDAGYYVANDAPISLTTRRVQNVRLVDITANRTLVFPSITDESLQGITVNIINRNATAYKWVANVALVTPMGTGITEIPNESVLVVTLTNGGTWRVISILKASDF